MMNYLFLSALLCVSTIPKVILAGDLPFVYVRQTQPQHQTKTPQHSIEYLKRTARSISDEAGDLPIETLRAPRSVIQEELQPQPESRFVLQGDLPFSFFRVPRSVQEEGDLPLEYFRVPRSAQAAESQFLGDLPYENFRSIRAEESEFLGDLPFEYLRAPRSVLAERTQYLEGDIPHEYFRSPRFVSQKEETDELVNRPDIQGFVRVRRSLQGGAPQFPLPGSTSGNAAVDISRQGQDTHASINAQHSTDRYEVGGQWSKVVRGPNKAKPEWNVRGSFKW